MGQLDLYLGNDESKQKFRFFLPLYVSTDRTTLFTKRMQWPTKIKAGSRLIIKTHCESSQFGGTKDRRYRLFIDESQAYTLPRSNGS